VGIHIPVKVAHRFAGTGKKSLTDIEVQQGIYFGKYGILRLEDD
jgi:mannose-6-phosphate isomerase-like protein (cupin superfamily)